MRQERGRVVVRARPLLGDEEDALGDGIIVEEPAKLHVIQQQAQGQQQSKVFEADKLVMPSTTAGQSLYKEEVQCLVDSLFGGVNSVLLAYGASGAGKTYTVLGSKQQPGLIAHIMDSVFDRADMATAIVRVSVEELHNQRFSDLLAQAEQQSSSRSSSDRKPPSTSPLRLSPRVSPRTVPASTPDATGNLTKPAGIPALNIRQLTPGKGGALSAAAPSPASAGPQTTPGTGAQQPNRYSCLCVDAKGSREARALIQQAVRRRHTAASTVNSDSSRSHVIVTITLIQKQPQPQQQLQQQEPARLEQRPASPFASYEAASMAAGIQDEGSSSSIAHSSSTSLMADAKEGLRQPNAASSRVGSSIGAVAGVAGDASTNGDSTSSKDGWLCGQGSSKAGPVPDDGPTRSVVVSKMHVVDLASSENLRRAEGPHSQEAGVINQSLCHLKRVVEMVFKGEKVPTYRNSKLTHRLQDALGGNSRLLVIACISTAKSQLAETKETLRFAEMARSITNTPTVNQPLHESIVVHLQQKVEAQQSQLQKQNDKVQQLQQVVATQALQLQQLQHQLLRRQTAPAANRAAQPADVASLLSVTAVEQRQRQQQQTPRIGSSDSKATPEPDAAESGVSGNVASDDAEFAAAAAATAAAAAAAAIASACQNSSVLNGAFNKAGASAGPKSVATTATADAEAVPAPADAGEDLQEAAAMFQLLEALANKMAAHAAELVHTAAEASNEPSLCSRGSSRRLTSNGEEHWDGQLFAPAADPLVGTLRSRASSKNGGATPSEGPDCTETLLSAAGCWATEEDLPVPCWEEDELMAQEDYQPAEQSGLASSETLMAVAASAAGCPGDAEGLPADREQALQEEKQLQPVEQQNPVCSAAQLPDGQLQAQSQLHEGVQQEQQQQQSPTHHDTPLPTGQLTAKTGQQEVVIMPEQQQEPSASACTEPQLHDMQPAAHSGLQMGPVLPEQQQEQQQQDSMDVLLEQQQLTAVKEVKDTTISNEQPQGLQLEQQQQDSVNALLTSQTGLEGVAQPHEQEKEQHQQQQQDSMEAQLHVEQLVAAGEVQEITTLPDAQQRLHQEQHPDSDCSERREQVEEQQQQANPVFTAAIVQPDLHKVAASIQQHQQEAQQQQQVPAPECIEAPMLPADQEMQAGEEALAQHLCHQIVAQALLQASCNAAVEAAAAAGVRLNDAAEALPQQQQEEGEEEEQEEQPTYNSEALLSSTQELELLSGKQQVLQLSDSCGLPELQQHDEEVLQQQEQLPEKSQPSGSFEMLAGSSDEEEQRQQQHEMVLDKQILSNKQAQHQQQQSPPKQQVEADASAEQEQRQQQQQEKGAKSDGLQAQEHGLIPKQEEMQPELEQVQEHSGQQHQPLQAKQEQSELEVDQQHGEQNQEEQHQQQCLSLVEEEEAETDAAVAPADADQACKQQQDGDEEEELSTQLTAAPAAAIATQQQKQYQEKNQEEGDKVREQQQAPECIQAPMLPADQELHVEEEALAQQLCHQIVAQALLQASCNAAGEPAAVAEAQQVKAAEMLPEQQQQQQRLHDEQQQQQQQTHGKQELLAVQDKPVDGASTAAAVATVIKSTESAAAGMSQQCNGLGNQSAAASVAVAAAAAQQQSSTAQTEAQHAAVDTAIQLPDGSNTNLQQQQDLAAIPAEVPCNSCPATVPLQQLSDEHIKQQQEQQIAGERSHGLVSDTVQVQQQSVQQEHKQQEQEQKSEEPHNMIVPACESQPELVLRAPQPQQQQQQQVEEQNDPRQHQQHQRPDLQLLAKEATAKALSPSKVPLVGKLLRGISAPAGSIAAAAAGAGVIAVPGATASPQSPDTSPTKQSLLSRTISGLKAVRNRVE